MTRRWLLALFALALLARLPGLDRSLWYDELFTLEWFAGSPLAALTEQVQANNHPLASLLAWAAQRVATTEAGLRAPFLLLGAAAAPALAWAAGRALGTGAGRVAGGLAALAPLHVVFAQQVRGYAGLLLCASLLVGLVPRVVGGAGGRRAEAALAACVALGAWSHATLLLPVAGWTALALVAPRLGLATAAGRAAACRALLGGGLGGLLLLAPTVDDLFKHARRALHPLAAAVDPQGPGRLLPHHLLDLAGGPGARADAVGLALAALLLGLAGLGAARALRAGGDARRAAACSLVPLLAALSLVALGAPAYPRLALFALPSWLGLAALGVCEPGGRRTKLALVSVCLLGGAWRVGELARAPLQDYRGAARVARGLVGAAGRVVGAGAGGALLRAYDGDVEPDEAWSTVATALAGDAAPADGAPLVVVVPFPAWTPPEVRARLEARGGVVLIGGRVSPIALWTLR